ncbi:MAG: hypothetical protein ACYTAF_14315 [Planctomycetota bacterium]|jgi:hypothetical protein
MRRWKYIGSVFSAHFHRVPEYAEGMIPEDVADEPGKDRPEHPPGGSPDSIELFGERSQAIPSFPERDGVQCGTERARQPVHAENPIGDLRNKRTGKVSPDP